jgi:hypothetical protein
VLASPLVSVTLEQGDAGCRAIVRAQPRRVLVWSWIGLLVACLAMALVFALRDGPSVAIAPLAFALVVGFLQWGFSWLAVPDYERARESILALLKSALVDPTP